MEQFPVTEASQNFYVLNVCVVDNGMVIVCPNCQARFENGAGKDLCNRPLSALCGAHQHFKNPKGCTGKVDKVPRFVPQVVYVSYGGAPAIPLKDYAHVVPFTGGYEKIETQVTSAVVWEWYAASADTVRLSKEAEESKQNLADAINHKGKAEADFKVQQGKAVAAEMKMQELEKALISAKEENKGGKLAKLQAANKSKQASLDAVSRKKEELENQLSDCQASVETRNQALKAKEDELRISNNRAIILDKEKQDLQAKVSRLQKRTLEEMEECLKKEEEVDRVRGDWIRLLRQKVQACKKEA